MIKRVRWTWLPFPRVDDVYDDDVLRYDFIEIFFIA